MLIEHFHFCLHSFIDRIIINLMIPDWIHLLLLCRLIDISVVCDWLLLVTKVYLFNVNWWTFSTCVTRLYRIVTRLFHKSKKSVQIQQIFMSKFTLPMIDHCLLFESHVLIWKAYLIFVMIWTRLNRIPECRWW